ncbi:hypothetical protein MARI_04530 [Marinobacter sp. JH2]|nr:glycosyltransferase [Marinobacter sp. JH2]QBM16373.1 hypothetical protein MARI_04530 [Marinobacter sp. JH2]
MRILHFISSPAAGGAETYVRDLSILMRRKGHDVHIVFLESAAESGRDLEFEKVFLESLSFESISYSFIGKDARKKPWLGFGRLRGTVKLFNPDVVHCHLYYALLFSFSIFNIPVLYTHHSFKLGLPKFFYRLFDQKVSTYIAICSACRHLLEGGGRNVVQINNAVSKERVIAKEVALHEAKSEVVCLFVGSLREPKNLSLMLSAFSSIQMSGVRLLIVGEGPEKEPLKKQASLLGIERQVDFLGNSSNIKEILAKGDVFLMSSAWEGLPIALIEATLAGLPVVVTNVGGCAEIVHKCANGFVVDSLEVDDYSAALKKMLDNFELRAFFSRNALAFSGEFEVESSVDKHLELYRQVSSAHKLPV